VFVGFSRVFLLGILIFKTLIARRLYKSFGVKGLMAMRQDGPICDVRSNSIPSDGGTRISNLFNRHKNEVKGVP
jgi:hypothetical protein